MSFLSIFFVNCFIPNFFLLVEVIIDFRGESILRRTILMLVTTNFFNFFQIYFKVEAAFPYSGNLLINILYPASSNGFSAQWKQYFLVSTISLLLEIIIKIRKKVLGETPHYCQYTTDFLASGNHFLSFFQAALKMEENSSRK